ncbi:MAG: ribosomal RNA small subunit methyltransferase A [Hyphomicrobiales bacterium]
MRTGHRSATSRSLSQHHLRNAAVAERIVAASGLAPPEFVIDAGAGDGVLTRALARHAGFVLAVEKDRTSFEALCRNTAGLANVRPVLGDILELPLPVRRPYHVVANLPFNATSAFIQRLVASKTPPCSAHLVVQRDAALAWTGLSGESRRTLLAKNCFDFDIVLALRRSDFVPPPSVEAVVLRIARRAQPRLRGRELARFERLVTIGFGGRHRELRANLRGMAGYERFRALAGELEFRFDAAPGELTFAQWQGLAERLAAAPAAVTAGGARGARARGRAPPRPRRG